MATSKKSKVGAAVPKGPASKGTQAKSSATGAESRDSLVASEDALTGVVAIEDRWFSPKAIGAIFGLDEKWLASIREGLKGIDGPPFKKLGTGKSAPIRYNYGAFKDWFNSFPSVINTQGKLAARAASALSFFSERDPHKQWLFAEVNGEPQDIVVAINAGAFDDDNDPPIFWLNYWEWLAKAALSGRMSNTISKLMRQVSEKAIAILEDDDFKATVPKAKSSVSTHKPSDVGVRKTRRRSGL